MDPQDLEVGKMYPIQGRMQKTQKWIGVEAPVAIYLGSFVDNSHRMFSGDHPTLYEFLIGDKIRNLSDYIVMVYIGDVEEKKP